MVPFGAGNRKTEGIVLELQEEETSRQLKAIAHVFDDEVVLQPQQKALALWMCRRYFCTFFQAANAMFPPGVWNRQGETYLPTDLSYEDLTGKKRSVCEVVEYAGKPLTATAISNLLDGADVKKELSLLVKSGHLTVQQHFFGVNTDTSRKFLI